MTQAIIPGCEASPDPKDVINVTQENTMEDTDKKMQESFDALLVSSANAAENGKALLEENKRLNEECEQLAERNRELVKEMQDSHDYQTLKDFKDCIDSTIFDEFNLKHDVEILREKMEDYEQICDVLETHNIYTVDELAVCLDDMAAFRKYRKGFAKLSSFAERIKNAITFHGEMNIPSTDIEDYD